MNRILFLPKEKCRFCISTHSEGITATALAIHTVTLLGCRRQRTRGTSHSTGCTFSRLKVLIEKTFSINIFFSKICQILLQLLKIRIKRKILASLRSSEIHCAQWRLKLTTKTSKQRLEKLNTFLTLS